MVFRVIGIGVCITAIMPPGTLDSRAKVCPGCNMSERIVGIDPGAKGALALFEGGELVRIADMPTVEHKGRPRVDAASVAVLLRSLAPSVAYVERVGAMPGQGVTSMFTFGFAAGIIWGALAGLMIPVTAITAAQWKVALHVPKEKSGARARASQLLPSGAQWWPMARHEGRAEAALIGLYGLRESKRAIAW